MSRKLILIGLSILALGVIFHFILNESFYWFLGFMGLIFLIGLRDALQKKNTILRNYPVIGHFRYLLLDISPEIHQYFVEGGQEGSPFHKNKRKIINARAAETLQVHPFGTEIDVYKNGSEWVPHSIYPSKIDYTRLKVELGGERCELPYKASIFNISAMSFGSLSSNAIQALNAGAQMGGFYHNTGEGGISPYHLQYGGDLVWQLGTGYFGCRNRDGYFDPVIFEKKSRQPSVKLIEIKLSQGAKPGHGGILPAIKNTEEIAGIRGLEPGTEVISPQAHTAFSDSVGLLNFVKKLRELSGGKPIGFKICIGQKTEFEDICQQMLNTGIYPDFITVDGSEGGTGAAPLEFSNYIGMPGEEALVFVSDMLRGFDLKKHIKIIYSGKIVTGFHIIRALSLGADLCNSARGMMFALGCIQSMRCHNNTCPTGVATQNKFLERGLVVNEKSKRVANFHRETVRSAVEILEAMGKKHPNELDRKDIFVWHDLKRTSISLNDLYPMVSEGDFLSNYGKTG